MSFKCSDSPIVYNTSVEQKRKAQSAAKQYRFGTTKLRDLLREKCRIRMNEARQTCFSQRRGLDSINDFDMKEVLRQELGEIESDINLQEEIYHELLEELNEWFVEQQESEESYLIDIGENNEFICPICQKSPLTQGDVCEINCKCGASFNFNGDLEQLRRLLQNKIEGHERNCQKPLIFFVEPQQTGNNALNLMCDNCDYFCSL